MALEVRFTKRLRSFTLAPDFSCDAEPLAILGPSGAGKSMTLRCIAGLERPDEGSIRLNGRTLFDSAAGINVPARQRGVGLLFQNYALFPHLTVMQNVAFGAQRVPRGEREARARKQIAEVHLEGLEHRLPRELSGGEQQRAALARALAIEPQALLLDEPLSALDTYLRSKIEQQLITTLAQFRKPTLYVTHNIEEAYRVSTKLVVLANGKVVANGTRDGVFRDPPNLEVALLTGLKNFSRARPVTASSIEALDWKCVLHCASAQQAKVAFVGIRAHHIGFAFGESKPNGTNVFPCWLVRVSETPFHATLYLHLHEPSKIEGQYHLQAEVTKEQWSLFRDQPQPWLATLPPETLLVLPE
ncbi:MAG TPA: ATP-binding cassette domain-containing protein [Candidatus Acidoferrales bacterium]|nr:ATP-binding cassette domain-containing protein [Candidatus Acidoferrales bacterium]